MATHTDPNQVRLTGENQYMRLHTEENGPDDHACQPLAYPPLAHWPWPRAVPAQRCDRG